MDTNRTMSSLSFGQGEFQYSVPSAISQPTLQGMDHFFGFDMPGARSPVTKPEPFSYAPGEGPFNIMCPDPRPSKCGLDKKTLACLNRMGDREHSEETTSPFYLNSGVANSSSDDMSSVFGQNSPVNSVAKLEDASFAHTPTLATSSAFTPFSWSSSSPSLFSSSASSCSSFSSCPPSTMPYNWSPNLHPSNGTVFTSPDWPNSMPRFFPNGDQQYHHPTTVNMQFGWEAASTNEGIVRVLNHAPFANNIQTDALSSSYAIDPYENVGLEPSSALPRLQAVPFACQGATASTTVPPQNEIASRPILSQSQPQYQSQSQSQSMYLAAPTNPNTILPATATSTAPVPMANPNNILHQRQQLSQTMANTNASMATTTAPTSGAPASVPTSSAPTPTSASHSNRNAFLIDCKRRGLSYRDIKRLGNFKEAESTLRGRYRTLTKSKDQRVRKPQWEEQDIRLLCDAVNLYSTKAELNLNRRTNVSFDQSQNTPAGGGGMNPLDTASAGGPPKVSWKKVAQYIWAHGGSYYFGNATCKKKWCEINGIDGGS